MVVEVKFDYVELESHSRCRYDYIAVFDGGDIDNDKVDTDPTFFISFFYICFL